MKIEQPPNKVKSIHGKTILNSHVEFTNEFVIELENGNIGVGASPQGETISIYEDKSTPSDPNKIVEDILRDKLHDDLSTQSKFDIFLQHNLKRFGRNNCWALSLAYFNAVHFPLSRFWANHEGLAERKFPRLCFNILNGGWHAYTNPVISDFQEYPSRSQTR